MADLRRVALARVAAPTPGAGAHWTVAARRFVIQQHDATRLHWDLRLEHDGVLLSWALPRGVPWSPDENRLAIHTDDHPLEFLDYEGDAFDPGYGSGRMTTWDEGTFELHKLEDEKVIITLAGARIAGKYALFSMRGSRDWLIHRMDPPVDPDRVAVPLGVPPMQATTGPLPEERGWTFEPRCDGLRVIVTDDTGRVMIHDADGTDVSRHFPEVRRIGRALGHREVILDGVIVEIADDGRIVPAGAGLARRLRIRSDSGARNAAKTAPVAIVAFDLLWIDGRPLTAQPWDLRRRRLEDLRLDGPAWRTGSTGRLDDMVEFGPLVAKRIDSIYRIGQTSPDWIQG